MATISQITKNAMIESSMNHILEKYIRPTANGESITIEDLKSDSELFQLFDQMFKEGKTKNTKKSQNSKKPKKEPQPKVSLEERAAAGIDHSKCLCRIWNKDRLDNIQCSSKKSDGDYCSHHAKKISEHGSWWLGNITDPRPENPYGPPGVVSRPKSFHKWKDQKETKNIVESNSQKIDDILWNKVPY
jgi:hypothetical protein